MNQIINNKNNNPLPSNYHNSDKKYKILFILFSSIAFLCFIFLFINIYTNNQNNIISQKLVDSYSVSTLYASTSDSTVELHETSTVDPFVIGIIKIDKIGLNYSILSITNDDLLDISVCRFAGPMPNEIGNLCIAGHNYINNKLFGRLAELKIGDEITIYDLSGNSINYSIYEKYETSPYDTSCTFQDTNNIRIVTLITCSDVNSKRLIIHAKEIT